MRRMLDGGTEEVGDGGMDVDRGGQGIDVTRGLTRPPRQERDPAQLAVDGGGGLSEDVVLPEIVAVIGAHDDPVDAANPCSSIASIRRPNQRSIMVSLDP